MQCAIFPLRNVAVRHILRVEPLGTVSPVAANPHEPGLIRSAALEKLFGAKTLETAIEVQSNYVKIAYEGFVAEATKLGELYTDLAKETYKPFEGLLAKVNPTK